VFETGTHNELDMVSFIPGYRRCFAYFVTKNSIFYFVVALVPVLKIGLLCLKLSVEKETQKWFCLSL